MIDESDQRVTKFGPGHARKSWEERPQNLPQALLKHVRTLSPQDVLTTLCDKSHRLQGL
jgi:hypothetical protein